mmetsp:Transcript_3084/g.4804  ORF Transcript_3084/g.4804 Transcript_3084/m.4804 type:complete len:205 (+) Transcript_3084:315-929(+)
MSFTLLLFRYGSSRCSKSQNTTFQTLLLSNTTLSITTAAAGCSIIIIKTVLIAETATATARRTIISRYFHIVAAIAAARWSLIIIVRRRSVRAVHTNTRTSITFILRSTLTCTCTTCCCGNNNCGCFVGREISGRTRAQSAILLRQVIDLFFGSRHTVYRVFAMQWGDELRRRNIAVMIMPTTVSISIITAATAGAATTTVLIA